MCILRWNHNLVNLSVWTFSINKMVLNISERLRDHSFSLVGFYFFN